MSAAGNRASPAPFAIRVLGRADAARFRALRLAALRESPEAFGSTYEEDLLLTDDVVAARLEEATTAPRRVGLGAVDGDRLVGFVGCVQEAKLKSRHKAFVWGMYVEPAVRGRGVGRALLRELVARVGRWDGVSRVTLSVVERAGPARALYRSVGFTRFGREPDGMRQDGARDAVEYLTLDLGRMGGSTMTDEHDELRERELELRRAQLASDVAALDRLLDDSLVFTGPDGKIYGKADDLELHRTGAIRIHRLEPSDERIQRFGNVAVVSVRMDMAGTFGGTPFDGPARYTRVWCVRPDGWRIVAGHVSTPAP
jgi:ribosomal protein S18 acetylase RimI-like enzyme/ketosteroid isomerase-like protein